MECRRIVQTDALGKIGQADAVPVAGDLLHDGEGARERLHAAARLPGAASR
jgi:HEAT repeat protein